MSSGWRKVIESSHGTKQIEMTIEKRESITHKDRNFLGGLKAQNKKQSNFMKDCGMVSNKVLEASYAVAKILVKTKQLHTIAKCLVLPCYLEIIKIMINESAVK